MCPSVTPLSRTAEDIFWTTKLYASKFGMMVHHYDSECHAKRLGSREYLSLLIYSEPLNRSSWNLVWCCIIMTWSVMQKGWVPIFKVKVTLRAHILSNPVSSIYISFATRFGMVVYHHESECGWQFWIAILKTLATLRAALWAALWTSCGRALSCERWVARLWPHYELHCGLAVGELWAVSGGWPHQKRW